MKFAQNQNKLERKELLEKVKVCVVWQNHPNGDLKGPNSQNNRPRDERHEEDHYFLDGLRALDGDQIQSKEDNHVNDCHLQHQES